MQSGRTSDAIRRNQTHSDAIRRNQTQSACPELCVSVFSCFGRAARACVLCFCVLGWHNGPVFCVFVFWQTPLKTQGGGKRVGRRMSRQGPGRSPSMGLTHLNAARPREKSSRVPHCGSSKILSDLVSHRSPACNTSSLSSPSTLLHECRTFLKRLSNAWAVN
jgi:hypothetical protein